MLCPAAKTDSRVSFRQLLKLRALVLKEIMKEASFIKRIVFNANYSFTLSLVAESWDSTADECPELILEEVCLQSHVLCVMLFLSACCI